MNEFLKDRKISHLRGTELTPEVVLARSLEKSKWIKSVVLIIHWNDNTSDVDHSRQTLSELTFALKTLDIEVQNLMKPRNA